MTSLEQAEKQSSEHKIPLLYSPCALVKTVSPLFRNVPPFPKSSPLCLIFFQARLAEQRGGRREKQGEDKLKSPVWSRLVKTRHGQSRVMVQIDPCKAI